MNPDDRPRNGEPADARPGPPRGPAQEPGTGFWDLLGQAERAALQELGQDSVFQAGDTICAEGEEATDVLVLTEGWVKVLTVTRERRELVLALRGHGDIVGELAGSSAGYRTATVVAVSLVRAVVVTHDKFTLFLDSNPEAGRAYRHALTQRWHETADNLRSRSMDNGAQRLAALLLDLAARHGTPTEGATVIAIPLSQDEIASLVGTSRATVTRALGHWRRRHLISTGRQQIIINDVPGLLRLAGRGPIPHDREGRRRPSRGPA
jgi:CRP-like cAMP-binding protein